MIFLLYDCTPTLFIFLSEDAAFGNPMRPKGDYYAVILSIRVNYLLILSCSEISISPSCCIFAYFSATYFVFSSFFFFFFSSYESSVEVSLNRTFSSLFECESTIPIPIYPCRLIFPSLRRIQFLILLL